MNKSKKKKDRTPDERTDAPSCTVINVIDQSCRSHLAPTLSTRLVAVRVEALVCLTVTGAAGLVAPPASGTRQVGPVHKHNRLHHVAERGIKLITHKQSVT